jgi:two-component system, NtrC family, response regulator GlrR
MRDKSYHTILVVDDDQDILSLLSKWFNDEGLQITTANSGEQALEQIEKNMPSLIISDLFMGEVSGLDLLTKVHGKNPLLPVIILSGQASIPDAIKATHLGSAAFITKPIDRQALLNSVKRYLRLVPDSNIKKIFESKLIYQSKIMSRTQMLT